MKTLTAKDTARAALRKRKVTDLAALVRGRVECFPGSKLWDKLEAAERKIGLLRYDEAEAMLREIDEAVARQEADLARAKEEAAAKAQAEHLAAHGIETHEVGAVRTRDGWLWLISRKERRITEQQQRAGENYAAIHAAAHRDGMCVGANDNAAAPLTIAQVKERAEANADAQRSLRAVHEHIERATGSARLSSILEAVCGRGAHLRAMAGGDQIKAALLEEDLRIALDMTGVALNILRQQKAA